jgi:hypothetical protein
VTSAERQQHLEDLGRPQEVQQGQQEVIDDKHANHRQGVETLLTTALRRCCCGSEIRGRQCGEDLLLPEDRIVNAGHKANSDEDHSKDKLDGSQQRCMPRTQRQHEAADVEKGRAELVEQVEDGVGLHEGALALRVDVEAGQAVEEEANMLLQQHAHDHVPEKVAG